jgi:hypothetical protein
VGNEPLVLETREPEKMRGLRHSITISFEKLHRSIWVPPSVELLTAIQLADLAEVSHFACGAGVYFLWLEDSLVYIGSSANVNARVRNHELLGGIRFDRATFMRVEWPWQMAIELLYIDEYAPPKNRQHVRSAL